ncbi:MAG: DUF6129 family protein [Magnetospiraceae bacterium]
MIDENVLNAVVLQLTEEGVAEQTVTNLRATHPGVHFTYCMDDDVVGPRPAFEGEGFNLYYVDAADHCLRLTPDYQVATGLVVAETEPD